MLEAERFKTDLLAALGHELRNPLTPLFAGVALIREANGDRETIEQHCTLMERQLRQLSCLVDDLLNAHGLDARTLRLQRSRIPLAPVVRTAIEEHRALIARSGHALSATLPATPTFIDGDPLRLGQAIGHLLRNAVKYTPHGGRIELSVERGADLACLSLRDTGIGIPADRLETIFETFDGLDRSLESGDRGLGLGLALVKAVVELHGGTVQAVSDGPGRGSEFRMLLPLVREETAAAPRRASAALGGTKRRVLLVDDNPDVARSLSRLIRILGHDIRVAYDGSEALRVADQFRPEVVVMDIGLPRLNGYDAARALRARYGRAVTLVALTGFEGDMHLGRSREAGFDRHLTKPIEAYELEALLGRVVPE
ncbi:MAG TPA: ATP-binding protein [Gammaproteobacteria bacterium]